MADSRYRNIVLWSVLLLQLSDKALSARLLYVAYIFSIVRRLQDYDIVRFHAAHLSFVPLADFRVLLVTPRLVSVRADHSAAIVEEMVSLYLVIHISNSEVWKVSMRSASMLVLVPLVWLILEVSALVRKPDVESYLWSRVKRAAGVSIPLTSFSRYFVALHWMLDTVCGKHRVSEVSRAKSFPESVAISLEICLFDLYAHFVRFSVVVDTVCLTRPSLQVFKTVGSSKITGRAIPV